ncbi:MAG: CBS domain-containing protein [Candidatus Peregrinibacteria bacterium]|nr:CBS domain-containing protein [Candidatus Peregrinibacteria bacterium]
MIYLSHLVKSAVDDSSDKEIGELRDILVKQDSDGYPFADLILVKDKKHKNIVAIPFKYVENLSKGEVTLNKIYSKIETVEVSKNHIYLMRDILDNQIIDVNGIRVVRVNDVKLAMIDGELSVVGLDISFKGIMRRLGIAWMDYFNVFKVNLINWRDAQHVHGTLQLNTVSEKLNRLHPADLANIVESLNIKQGSKLLSSMDTKNSAKILEEVNPIMQKALVGMLDKGQALKIVEKMSIDELADLIQSMPYQKAKQFLSDLHSDKLEKIEELLLYPEDTAGGLMTNEFITVPPSWTKEDAIRQIKEVSKKYRTISYIYVIDKNGKFLGPISMRSLVVADKNVKLKKLLKPVKALVTLRPENSLHEVVNLMTKYDLFTATVVNKKGRLLGIVTLDDVMRCLAPAA